MNKSDRPIVITGEWDGQPIWRYKTQAEILFEEILKNKKARLLAKEKKNEK